MNLEKFIAREIDKVEQNVASWKSYKKFNRKNLDKKELSRIEASISAAKDKITKLKKLRKLKLARLASGKVISISTLEAFEKKLAKSKIKVDSIQQYDDGLVLQYSTEKGSGSLTITGFGVDMEIPEEVELPKFMKGEVVPCLLKS